MRRLSFEILAMGMPIIDSSPQEQILIRCERGGDLTLSHIIMRRILPLLGESSMPSTGVGAQRSPSERGWGADCSCFYGLRHHLHAAEFQREMESLACFQRLRGKQMEC